MSLVLRGVTQVHRGGRKALSAVDLALRSGEQVALVGPSGAGKTTLLRVLGAALQPTLGDVTLLGIHPWLLSPRRLRTLRARIGFVHQSPPLPPRLRVVTAVLAGRLGQWSAWQAARSLLVPRDVAGAREALTRMALADRLFDRCDRLSGGQLQRVAVARTLYQRPVLLLADEPVSSLDPTRADLVLGELVAQSRDGGATLVASLHAVDLALKWFPRVVGMRDGRIVFDRAAADVTPQLLADLYAPTADDEPEALEATAGAGAPMAPMCR